VPGRGCLPTRAERWEAMIYFASIFHSGSGQSVVHLTGHSAARPAGMESARDSL
jgi:hypothetical protein